MKASLSPILNSTYLFVVLLAVALYGCDNYATPVNTGEKIMSELTKTMRPVCFGRLVVEIPTAARIMDGWDQKIDYIKIESVSPTSLNRKTFEAKVAQLEKQLKTSPHDTDGVLLKSKTQLTPDSVLFVYREDQSDNFLYQLDVMFWSPNVEYKFHLEISTEDLAEGINMISKVVKSFLPTPTSDLLNLPPGLCVEHGIFTGTEFRDEEVAFAGRIDEYPGLGFSFQTQSTDRPSQDPTMIQRIEDSFGMDDDIGRAVTAATRFIRKGKRQLNGQLGEEIVIIYKENGETTMDAQAEFYYTAPTSLDRPIIRVSLSDQTHDDNTHQPYNKNLTEKEFLALWDSLLNGIKPRPKNPWVGDSNKK